MSTAYCFDRFEVRPVERRLLVDGQPAAIGARAFDLLTTLVESPGRLLTKGELLDRVWPGLVVEEANLHVQVSSLRKLLGPQVIATIPGQGYRLAVTAERATSEAIEQAAAGSNGVQRAAAPNPSATVRRDNLPEWSDALLGRETDLELLNRLLDLHRLVTLVGPSGIGKTRLAQAVARQRLASHSNGVWWIDLSSLRTVEQIAPAIAQAAGVPLGDGDAPGLLRRALALRDTLLVLDNCEHLIEAMAALSEQLLDGAPRVRLLATSLEPLKVRGEQTCRLDGLAIPPAAMSVELARCFGSVQLLEQRAQAVDHRFRLSEAMVPKAIDLCRQLDGIALAIEMAAARLPVLGFDAVGARLGERLQLLRNNSRAAPARHQTLGATLDWSHSLLNDDEKTVLRRLATFVGSFRLDAALAVATAQALDESAVLDALFGLVDKSMLQIIELDPPRYRLLESTRLYAAQRLEESGEAGVVTQRHAQALASLAVELDTLRWVTPDRRLVQRFVADHDDLQVAYRRASAAGWISAAADIGVALSILSRLYLIGAGRRQRMQLAAQLLPAAQGRARAKLLRQFVNTFPVAIKAVSRADAARELVALYREGGDAQRLYEALGRQAGVFAAEGDMQTASDAVSEGRQLEQAEWPVGLRVEFTYFCGEVCMRRGDIEGYARAMQDVLELSVRAGFDHWAWAAQLGLAEAALLANDPQRAIAICRQGMQTARELGMEVAWGLAAAQLGAAQVLAGGLDEARETLRQCQPVLASTEMEGWILSHVALLGARLGHSAEAARLLGASDAWYAANRNRPEAVITMLDVVTSAELNAALGAAEFARLRAAGAAMRGDEPCALLCSVIGTGEVARSTPPAPRAASAGN